MEMLNSDERATSEQRLPCMIVDGLTNSLSLNLPRLDQFRALLARMVGNGADLTTVTVPKHGRRYTPLLRFLDSWKKSQFHHNHFAPDQRRAGGRRWKRREQFQLPLLTLWARELRDAGVDLMWYGQQEKLLHARGSVDPEVNLYYIDDRMMISRKTVRLVGFRYGPSPEDWHAWFSNWRDEFSGEFWNMVEMKEHADPELQMPGAWVGE
ncbi:hypothetical protein VTN77DRAFT_7516 [Rasamsonia byssochlamydoides]|uniref:uncharacterized protein n=1 Tax=Rasamsonia byssochlamydoides TaxID=89139 RepID=UPI003742D314